MASKKFTARIFLRSGQTLEFEVTRLIARRSALGALTEIEWEGATNAPLYLDFSQVVAVQG